MSTLWAAAGRLLRRLAVWAALCAAPVAVHAAPGFCPAAAALPAGTPTLKVGVKYAPPFAMQVDRAGWKGLAVELWDTAALCLGTRHTYVEYATTPELLAAVEQGEVDVAVGALSITAGREQRVDFSQAFHNGALGVLVRDVAQTRGFADVLRGFVRADVALLVAGLVLATAVIAWTYWRVERVRGNALFAAGPAQGLYHALLWSVMLVFSGRGDPFQVHHRAGQLFVLFLTFFGVTIVSGVTAVITSSLTLQGMPWRLQHVADLKRLDVAVMNAGRGRDWAVRERLYVQQLRSWPEVQRRFDERAIEAFVHDRDVLQHMVKDGYLKDVRVEPLTLSPEGYGMAVAAGSPLREAVDQSLLAIREDGVWPVLLEKYLGSR